MIWICFAAGVIGALIVLNRRPIMRALARLVHWHPGD